MTARKSDKQEGADVPTIPTKAAPTPSVQVPTPKPAPAAQTAPHLAAGVVNDVKMFGSAVDPFTGKTVTAADLA